MRPCTPPQARPCGAPGPARGPTLLEVKVARIRGHFIGDHQQYRPRPERQQARERDPVALLAERLGEDVAPHRAAVAAEIDAAFETGPQGAWPDAATVERDVYAPDPPGPPAPATAPPAEREISFLEAVNEALDQAMSANDSVITLGEDIAGGAGLGGQQEGAMGGTFGATRGDCWGPSERRECETRPSPRRVSWARPPAPPSPACAPWWT